MKSRNETPAENRQTRKTCMQGGQIKKGNPEKHKVFCRAFFQKSDPRQLPS
jgi:hypothetical protein